MSYYLGIDLGGTNIAVGLVDGAYNIVARGRVKTAPPRPVESLVRDMAEVCESVATEAGIPLRDITWVGIGSPGVVWNGAVYYSSNLDLHDSPLASLLQNRIRRPVFLQNDANTAAYGEYLAGAGRGCHSLVILTIGTGIGSGIILEDKIHVGFNGVAAELGHVIIEPGGRLCSCGNRGCVEPYCSATALAQAAVETMEKTPHSKMWELCGGKVENATAKTPFQAMRMGDEAAAVVVDEFISYLAVATAGAVNLLQPEVFCIGGGVSREGDAIILPLRERVEALTFAGRDGLRTRIRTAMLGNDAGIIGAAMLGNLRNYAPNH